MTCLRVRDAEVGLPIPDVVFEGNGLIRQSYNDSAGLYAITSSDSGSAVILKRSGYEPETIYLNSEKSRTIVLRRKYVDMDAVRVNARALTVGEIFDSVVAHVPDNYRAAPTYAARIDLRIASAGGEEEEEEFHATQHAWMLRRKNEDKGYRLVYSPDDHDHSEDVSGYFGKDESLRVMEIEGYPVKGFQDIMDQFEGLRRNKER